MDTNVRQKTNYVVRDKMGIADRRKNETDEQKAQRVEYKRRTDAKPPVKKRVVKKK